MKNKDVAIHFTKIARDKFQIYNFQTKDNQIANTRDLAAYLTNLRGGVALDNSFYSKLISMPNFSTIAITEDALKIKKAAANGKIEPWKLEKTADGEVFVSAIEEDEEDDAILKKSASCHLKHHYVISIKAKNENQKITTYASLKKSACIPETEIELSPINDYVNFDYYSEKNPYDVIQAIVDLLVATGVAVEPSQVECCHDFCDCGMDQVGPVVPCEENEYILDCYGEEPIIGQSVDSLQSYASAHNKKHFKIYAFDKVVFDSDAIKRKAADETTQKTKYILAGYTDGKAEFVEKEEYATLDGAKNAFDSFKEKAHKKDDFGNELSATEFYIYETKDNGTTHDKTWKITSPVDLLPMQEEMPVEEKTEVEVKEPALPAEPKPLEEPKLEETDVEVKEPQPLPTGEKKEEIEKKVETPEGQKLEEKVEQTVNASIKNTTKKVAFTYGAGSSDDPGTRNYEVILKEPGFDLPLISSIITKEDLANLLTNLVASQDTDLVKFREFYDELTSVLGKIIDAFPELKKQVKAREYKNFVSEIRNICNWFWHPANDFIIKPEIQEAVPHEFEPINEEEKPETSEGQKLEENVEETVEPKASIKGDLGKKAEINADPKVVLDKLRTGDLLTGTEERKEGLKKVVNDETYKEEIEKLKNDGKVTEKEIEEAKDDINKTSADNFDNMTSKDLVKYYKDHLDGFIDDYFGNNAALQSEVDFDFLNSHKKEVFEVWENLMSDTEDENDDWKQWKSAEKAYNQVFKNKSMTKSKDNIDKTSAKEDANNYAEVVKEVTGATDVKPTNYDNYGLKTYDADSEEWSITDNYKEVEEAVKEDISNLLDDLGIDAFLWDNMGGIENFLDTTWFEEARQESNEAYAEDILSSEPERFIEEAKELKLDTNYEGYNLNDPDGDHSAAISDFAEAMKEQQEESAIEWFINNIGKDSLKDIVKAKNISFDIDAIAEKIMNMDGPGHVLASYDGEMVEKEQGGKTYYLFRIASSKNGLKKESKVVKKDDKYQVQSEKGKNLGTYDTKEEAKDRLKEVEMFKHMDKKADNSKNFTKVVEDMGDESEKYWVETLRSSDEESSIRTSIYNALRNINNSLSSNDKESLEDDIESALIEYKSEGKSGQTYEQFVLQFIDDLDENDKRAIQEVDKYIKEKGINPKSSVTSADGDITKEADKVLVDKNTNQPLKPGETTEGKELKEVEVDKSEATTTTASNAVYNLFMKSATIEVNRDELSLLTAAYHSPIFKKVAYLGPTAFAFRDQHAIFTVEGNKATCRKEADLTTVEIKKQEQANPGSLDSLSDNQLRDYIASLNKKLEVK